jgi:hypothetical protein
MKDGFMTMIQKQKFEVKSGDIPVLLRRENLRLFLLQEKF